MNRDLQKKRRAANAERKEGLSYSYVKTEFNAEKFPERTPEQREATRIKIRAAKQKRTVAMWTKTAIIVSCLTIFFYLVLAYFFEFQKKRIKKESFQMFGMTLLNFTRFGESPYFMVTKVFT